MYKSTIITYLFALGIVFLGGASLRGQNVWPGDINNNGQVSAVDVLYLGVAFGNAGPPRDGATTNWEAQPISTLWPNSFPDGLNYAYADANGDGFIDDDDLDDAISPNFGLTQGTVLPDGYANAPAGSGAPALRLQSATTFALPGSTFTVDLLLGDANQPVAEAYGVAFQLSYDADLIDDDNGLDFTEDPTSWLNFDNGDLLDFDDDNEALGMLWAAISRTNQLPATGGGVIGQFSIFIEDIIVGLEVDTLHLVIDSVKLVTPQLTTVATVPASLAIPIVRDSSLVTVTGKDIVPPASGALRVYPNPSQGTFNLINFPPSSSVRLYDALGREIPLEVTRSSAEVYQITVPSAPAGAYYLRGYSPAGHFTQLIIISSVNQ